MNDIKKLLKLSLMIEPKDYHTFREMIDKGIDIKDISRIVNTKNKILKKRHIKIK